MTDTPAPQYIWLDMPEIAEVYENGVKVDAERVESLLRILRMLGVPPAGPPPA